MKPTTLRIISALLTAVSILTARAHDSVPAPEVMRPSVSAFTIEVGSASILDTYLTPIRYHGVNTRIAYEGLRAMGFNPERWIMQGAAAVEYANVQNPAGNHTMHSLMIDAKWGMMYRWRDVLTPGLTLHLGGAPQLRGGVIYNAYNSNNPVSAKIRASLCLTAMATYHTKLCRLPITLRYQATLPAIGAFFSLDYGEAFYELYLGNTSGIVNVGWWGNRFDMENLITADLHLGSTVLRLGYRNLIENSWVHNLNTQICTHGFVVGFTSEWLTLSPRRKPLPKNVRLISPIY